MPSNGDSRLDRTQTTEPSFESKELGFACFREESFEDVNPGSPQNFALKHDHRGFLAETASIGCGNSTMTSGLHATFAPSPLHLSQSSSRDCMKKRLEQSDWLTSLETCAPGLVWLLLKRPPKVALIGCG